MPEGVFGRAVRRACASVAFPHPSSYGCIVWVREACRCHALPWVVWGAVCTLRRSWRSWCRGGLRLRRAGRGQLGGDWDVERVRESPEDAADRPALTYTSCSVWLGGGRRPSGCQPPFLGRDSPSIHTSIAVWRTVSRPLWAELSLTTTALCISYYSFCRPNTTICTARPGLGAAQRRASAFPPSLCSCYLRKSCLRMACFTPTHHLGHA